MKTYLKTLHQRPDRHKKNFALLVSGLFTLLIFSLWSLVHLQGDATVAANDQVTSEAAATSALSPFAGLKETFENSVSSLKTSVDQAKQGLKTVDVQNDYTQVRNEALNQETAYPNGN